VGMPLIQLGFDKLNQAISAQACYYRENNNGYKSRVASRVCGPKKLLLTFGYKSKKNNLFFLPVLTEKFCMKQKRYFQPMFPTGIRVCMAAVCLPVLLFSGLNAGEHPHLYFTRGDLPALRAQAAGAKSFQFERLRRWGEISLEKEPAAQIGTSERLHEEAFSTITCFGFLYQITGENKYLAAGRRWLAALLDTPTASGGNYHIGIFAASLAHGYDFFFQGLEPDFRNKLKAKLIDVLREARYGADHYWWGGVYTHHDTWIPVAGMGIAALCLKGEYEQADTLAGFAKGELSRAINHLGNRGYWGEGVADWVYCLAPTLMFFDCLARAAGPDFYEHPWIKATARVRLAHWLPDDTYMFIGDSYRSGRYGNLGSVSAHVLMRLAARYRDSHAQWLALRDARVDSGGPARGKNFENSHSFSDMRSLSAREMHGLAWQFFWYDPELKPEPPDTLPENAFYPNWDSALMRSGWGSDDPVLFFAGGHMLGALATEAWKAGNRKLSGGVAHTHQNAGSIYLWADGRFVLAPPAYGGRDGRFHSTVMVDGHGQLFEPDHRPGSVVFDSGDDWTYVRADLTACYPEQVGLDRLVRQVVYLKPRTIVLCDRLVTRNGDKRYIRRYEWLLHTDPGLAEWRAAGDSLAVVLKDTGGPVLKGRVFPSDRYFFERQSMDQPNGRPKTRALSLTMIGRLPSEVEIAAVLHAPREGGRVPELDSFVCSRDSDQTTVTLPVSSGSGRRCVVFAAGDTVRLGSDLVAESGSSLILGLGQSQRYALKKLSDKVLGLVPDESGEKVSTEAGTLCLTGINSVR